ncbi:MAG: hypothetical protein ABIV26_07325 [Candidatus Limnocylindrales bacterium]
MDRPVRVDIAAAILAFVGLFGWAQLAIGDYVVTGSLPAKGPVIGVAFLLYAAAIALGVLIRTGRAWLPAVNLAAVFAVVHALALGPRTNLLIAILTAAAFGCLLLERRWFWTVSQGRRSHP